MSSTLLAALAATLGAANAQSDLVKRGDYLVNGILTCGNCHSPKGPTGDIPGKLFSGGLSWDEPPFKVTAPNITQDKETGIGKWTDARDQDAAAHRHPAERRAHRDGHADRLLPHHDRARSRTRSSPICARIKPISNKVADPIYKMPQVEHVLPGGEKPYTEAMMGDKVKKGFYLATIAHCMECHTPMEKGMRQWDTRLGAGGFEFPGPWGVSVSRNITSSKTKGIGAWTDAEIKTRHHHRRQQGRQPPQAADGLPLLRHADRRRPRRRRRLSAHGAGEGVACHHRAVRRKR